MSAGLITTTGLSAVRFVARVGDLISRTDSRALLTMVLGVFLLYELRLERVHLGDFYLSFLLSLFCVLKLYELDYGAF